MSDAYQAEKAKLGHFLDPTQCSGRSGKLEELRTSPLVSLNVRHGLEKSQINENEEEITGLPLATSLGNDCFQQYALLGMHAGDHPLISEDEPILQNTRAPTSAFICGSQGSGKSYTLSCMLENCLLPDKATGAPGPALAGVVFHYDVDASNSLAEAASLCSRGIKVRVLVSATCRKVLERAYMSLPNAKGNITMQTLYFQEKDLTIARIMKLMAFSDTDGRVPLYVSAMQRILREMAISGDGESFNFSSFKTQLNEMKFTKDQTGPLDIRMGLLESFMPPKRSFGAPPTPVQRDGFDLKQGTLTIVDLSSPFVDSATVNLLFDICLGLFKQNRPRSGLVVALDEAHKFLDGSAGATAFTERLFTTIREQRHNATRVIVATQEPTVSPSLLDLCSVCIVHRFTSPAWFPAIKGHLGGASADVATFERIMALGVGESFVFAPSAHVFMHDGQATKLGSGVFTMKTRRRLGTDQGLSKLADAGEESESESDSE